MSAVPAPKRFSKEEYYRLGESGFLDKRTELIEGRIYEMSPIGPEHAHVANKLLFLIQNLVGPEFVVRGQSPLDFCDSQPEPDVAVIRASEQEFVARHPGHADLVVEVSQSSLAYDLGVKATIYAKAGVPEYWVVDLSTKSLRVLSAPTESGYLQETVYGHDARVATLLGFEVRLDSFLS